MEHFNPCPAEADLIEQGLQIFHATLGIRITFQVMTGAFQSACHHDAVCAVLKGFKSIQDVEFAGAGQQHDSHIGWILHARGAREIGRRVRAKVAAKGE